MSHLFQQQRLIRTYSDLTNTVSTDQVKLYFGKSGLLLKLVHLLGDNIPEDGFLWYTNRFFYEIAEW